MGGMGKTTLARNVYNDPLIDNHFHTRAWVSISQEHREPEILLNLLDSMELLPAERHQENGEKRFPLLWEELDLAEGKVDGFPFGETRLVHSR
ncbi:late blight resistance homolog R1B-14 isoform X4 [Olea europaea subsp. europaea]|uniref:Late blight resistance homolog R1B-14 isoform X4 n=1 Tax=Olea europaea subsp. europaea TaxID=158383 RepID=A0A8S0PMR6_OLEEU|nr:late blight resistance homolog R1B-14 isoform X4 [Olea europaea subsp. europaea]